MQWKHGVDGRVAHTISRSKYIGVPQTCVHVWDWDSSPRSKDHRISLEEMVGETGFEPATPWSRTRCSTRLSHSPTLRENCQLKEASRACGAPRLLAVQPLPRPVAL